MEPLEGEVAKSDRPKDPPLVVRPMRIPGAAAEALTQAAEASKTSFNALVREIFLEGAARLSKNPLPVLGLAVRLSGGTWNVREDGRLVPSDYPEWVISKIAPESVTLQNLSTGHAIVVGKGRMSLTRGLDGVVIMHISVGVLLFGDTTLYVKALGDGSAALDLVGQKRIFFRTALRSLDENSKIGLLRFLTYNRSLREVIVKVESRPNPFTLRPHSVEDTTLTDAGETRVIVSEIEWVDIVA